MRQAFLRVSPSEPFRHARQPFAYKIHSCLLPLAVPSRPDCPPDHLVCLVDLAFLAGRHLRRAVGSRRGSEIPVVRDAEVDADPIGPALAVAIPAGATIQPMDEALVADNDDVAVRPRQLHQAPAHAAGPPVAPPLAAVVVDAGAAALGEVQEGVPPLELRAGAAVVEGPVAALAQRGPDLDGDRGVGPAGAAYQGPEGDHGRLEGAGQGRDDDEVGRLGELDGGGLAPSPLCQDWVPAWET